MKRRNKKTGKKQRNKKKKSIMDWIDKQLEEGNFD